MQDPFCQATSWQAWICSELQTRVKGVNYNGTRIYEANRALKLNMASTIALELPSRAAPRSTFGIDRGLKVLGTTFATRESTIGQAQRR